MRPLPLIDLGFVDAVLVGVTLAFDLHVAQLLLGMSAGHVQRRHAVDHVHRQAEAVDLILDGQVKRRVDVALLLVAAHMQVPVVRAPVSKAMDQPRIAVEVENDRLIHGEEAIEVAVR